MIWESGVTKVGNDVFSQPILFREELFGHFSGDPNAFGPYNETPLSEELRASAQGFF